ncbi:unnamed protein product [Mucor circinelloides]|uniref:Uncharacterized protein n=1 Tax=Mucor circinelloides f. circinelloides (strain 1006PhL) TaxID=1220926 RepID=S2J5D0_MUCC1|nr:hypothetical protein HMPREF1544_09900 [Mucor circinelloides 1006PhL]
MQSQPFIYNNIQPQPAPVPVQYQQPQPQQQQFTQASVIDSLNAVNQHIQQQQQQHQQQPQPEKKLDVSYKRQSDGPILWFAGPPLNVIPDSKPLHSVSYLDWKKKQQQQ